MRFWDSSALIPLLVDQPSTEPARRLLEEDPALAVWWATPIECASAFARLRREGIVTEEVEAALSRRLIELRDAWFEIVPGDGVRDQALRLLRIHPLRSADAMQLAAALEWSGSPASGDLVTFDHRLARAARREGFRVLGVSGG